MKPWIWVAVVIGSVIILIALSSTGQNKNSETENSSNNFSSEQQSIQNADKVIVVNFFGNQRCVSCKAVGDLTKKTLNEKFAEELKSGRIELLEINGELPENKDVVIQYQARGSSLFINAIVDGNDNIEEDTTVWNYIGNESRFISYLEDKINKLLGS